MNILIKDKKTDIYAYPKVFNDNQGSLTIGDLHGNTIKLLYFLLRHKIIDFRAECDKQKTYQAFVDLYEQSRDRTLTKPQLETILQTFHQLVDTIEVIDNDILIRLIGDEVADRGNNDYFTLKLLFIFLIVRYDI